jgi:predicted ATPase
MQDAMASLRKTGGELIYNFALSLLAESYFEAREPEKGLEAIAEAIKGIATSGQHMHEAERRLRGELLVLSGGLESETERSFQRALEIAQDQHASWELRAATSLARFLRTHNRHDEAKSKLAPILASFTEGFETTDLKQARALLSDLG